MNQKLKFTKKKELCDISDSRKVLPQVKTNYKTDAGHEKQNHVVSNNYCEPSMSWGKYPYKDE